MTWGYDDMVIWWYDDMMTWWYGDMMIWWYDDMMLWLECQPSFAPPRPVPCRAVFQQGFFHYVGVTHIIVLTRRVPGDQHVIISSYHHTTISSYHHIIISPYHHIIGSFFLFVLFLLIVRHYHTAAGHSRDFQISSKNLTKRCQEYRRSKKVPQGTVRGTWNSHSRQ